MNLKDIKIYLQKQMPLPENGQELEGMEMNDALQFLLASRNKLVPMYISCKNFFCYSLIVPIEKLTDDYIDDLFRWNLRVSSGYGYCTSRDDAYLCDPMENTRSKILDGSVPVFFLRDFEGESRELEINQKISHVLGIFWVNKEKAFCKFNEIGDYEKIATMEDNDIILCTLKKEELDVYLFLSKSVLIRVFEITRRSKHFVFPDKDRVTKLYTNPHEDTFAKLTTHYNKEGERTIAYLRGFQVIRNNNSYQDMMDKVWGIIERKYESFIIHDWKHDKLREWSSDPEKIGNYFVESDLPYETSPAFFRSEVLAKYKHDPEKYTIESRTITCRAAWSLRYDVNDEGQIMVYLIDISHLPYTEQQYWKSFNEEPKSGISERTFKTDFEGNWDIDYDPLFSLKNILQEFPNIKINGQKLNIWKMPKLKPTKNINFLNYILTDSTKEWEDQISVLNQILVEGLQSKMIKSIAKYLQCDEKNLGSVKQIAKCLETLDIAKEDINTIVVPLFELIHMRKIIVHAIDSDYPDNLKQHYKGLIEKCDKSMRKLAELIDKGVLNISEESK